MADTINPTPEQLEAIDEIDHNLQIIACAGSGKTEVITRRIANIIEKKPDIMPGTAYFQYYWEIRFMWKERKPMKWA